MRSGERKLKRPGLSLLTAALLASTMASVPQAASAAGAFWGRDAGATMVPQPMQRKRAKAPRTAEHVAEKTMPEGPLIVAISIQHQHLKVFDIHGLYAESPVSTGMPGHSTPMGVFSVIEKQRWHRSNIYSGAPMPYMQRITWSGVAMHEGVLPGYAASHGCIRMPGAFAIKLFGWTKRGARVIVVPGEISIEEFSHPKLIAHMLDEQKFANAAPVKRVPQETATFLDKADDIKPELKLATLADASGSGLSLPKLIVVAEKTKAVAPIPDSKANDSRPAVAKSDAAKEAPPPQQHNSIAATDAPGMPTEEMAAVQSVEHTIDQAAAMVEAAPVNLGTAQQASDDHQAVETTASATAAPAQPAATPVPKPEIAAVPAKQSEPASQAALSPPATTTPRDTTTAPNDVPTVIGPKRTGHIAVFISRKDRRLYVRQNFSPVFDVPITIADADKPFGTFVFTARGDKDDSTALHWSVVAMPYATKKTVVIPLAHHGKKAKPVVETSLAAPPSTAAEALDRITVPDWALQRVAEAIKPGGSLIVSDHGLGDETGEGTDFIVPLR
jgi:hypothetical protein